jgi:predicted secreted protein
LEKALGTKLLVGANSVAELNSIGGLDLSADTIDTTTLESVDGWRTFQQGLKDGGEVPLGGFFNVGDTNGQIALYNAFNSGALLTYTILFPFGASWNFSGIVVGISTGAELEDGVSFEATIKVSGKPSLGLTPSAGLTALSLVGVAGALTPAFNVNNNLYAFSGVTASSVTVTATAANHTINLFVDGVLTQTLTSGVASAAIAIAAVGSKKLTLVVNEPSKAPKVYEIALIKTA